jgi:integrase
MASVFKLGADKGNRKASYWIEYFDHLGMRRRKKGFRDVELTRQLAGKLEQEVMLRKRGMVDPQADKLAEHRRAAVATHLAAFEAALKQRGNTPKHVALTMTRLRSVLGGGDIATLGDLDAERVQAKLGELRRKNDLGPKTYNHYAQAVDAFGRWLARTGRAAANPLAGLARLNAEVEVRHQRRALTPDEVQSLIDSARTSGKRVQGYDGEQRARLYQLSYLTGLRRSELASLTPASFDLRADPPTVTVAAACSKHRRTDVLPLHPELVAVLPGWFEGMKRDQKVFPKLDRKKTWLMVKLDLERAGVPYVTEEGIADFHASGRHSYVTGLLRHGATLTETMELARHSDVRMTMRYTHIGLGDQAKALAALPSPGPTPSLQPAATADPNAAAGGVAGQQFSQQLGGPTGQTAATRVRAGQKGKKKPEAASALQDGTYDASGQEEAEPGTDPAEWRRRESNPQAVTRRGPAAGLARPVFGLGCPGSPRGYRAVATPPPAARTSAASTVQSAASTVSRSAASAVSRSAASAVSRSAAPAVSRSAAPRRQRAGLRPSWARATSALDRAAAGSSRGLANLFAAPRRQCEDATAGRPPRSRHATVAASR